MFAMSFLASKCLLLCFSLLYLQVGCVSTTSLRFTIGTDVTLPCRYDARSYGKLPVCWGRGEIPNRGCANQVIKSDGTSVTSRLSERYLLMGNLGQGDASLTIRQVVESDSGVYGCRVDIPGWFNDHKQQVTLTVVPARPDPLRVDVREVKERTITVRWAHVFDGGRPITSYRIDLKSKQAPWDTAVKTEVTNPALTQVTLVDLRPTKSYNLRMFAFNGVGMSDASNVLTVTTKEAAPEGPPLDMRLEAITSQSIKVTWKPPRADLRNGVLRSYSVSYREYDPDGGQFKHWHHQTVTATRDLEILILSNLKPSTKYGVIVQAKTNAGIGPASTAPFCSTLDEADKTSTPSTESMSSTTMRIHDTTSLISVHTTSTIDTVIVSTPWEQSTASFSLGRPDPPIVTLKEVKDNAVSLFWTPGDDRGNPITGYILEYKAVNSSWDYTKTVADFSANMTEATIIEINPSTYNIRMFAENDVGISRASNVLTITTGETGHQRDMLPTPTSSYIPATVRVDEDRGGHLVAIVVTVVLVVLVVIVATVIAWQLRKMAQKKGILSKWLTGGTIRYRGVESRQEL